MPGVVAKKNESFESLHRRFKKTVERSGLMRELHKRECFQRKGDVTRRAKMAAVKRHKKQVDESRLVGKRLY